MRLLLPLLVWLGLGSLAAADRPPNLIFILADDLGYGELGCYGQKKIRTPRLDRMAAEGMRFTQFYAGGTVCAPSRSVLMTGQHLGHTRVRGNAGASNPEAQRLQETDLTIARVLQGAGYATGLVGKWGLGLPGDSGHPNRQGFDEFFGFLSQQHAHNHYPDHLWRNAERVPLDNRIVPVGSDGAGYATNRAQYAGDLFALEARRFVERHRDRPFFLYYAATVPHANNERTARLGNGQEVPDYGPYATNVWPDPLKGQAAMVSRLDADVGQLLDHLRTLGLDQHTVVFFSSDNGPHREGGNDPEFFDANGPFRGLKRDLYDGGLRVPMIVRWPDTIRAGSVSTHVGYFGDFFATACDLAGIRPPRGLDSVSLMPTLLGHPTRQRRHPWLYWEFHERGFSQAVLLEGRWKGIRLAHRDAPIHLYDLHGDPGEIHDLAAQEPDVVARIDRLFRTARQPTPLWPGTDAPQR